jgi:hypothetical protein
MEYQQVLPLFCDYRNSKLCPNLFFQFTKVIVETSKVAEDAETN